MKTIYTSGILSLEPLGGGSQWYWGSDYAQGDLYEAEELYRDGHPVNSNRLVFVHYPDGRVVEPIKGRAGQYFGRPAFWNGKIWILLADFSEEQIRVLRYDDVEDTVSTEVSLPRTEVEDCYNLLLCQSPLMLTRQANDGRFQILWPEKVDFAIGERESLICWKGDTLYFSQWHEGPEGQDYREEVLARRYPTGEVREVIPGAWQGMPDGQVWLLR